MTEVEKFWIVAAAKCGDTRPWSELNFMEQMAIVNGLNMILSVMKLPSDH